MADMMGQAPRSSGRLSPSHMRRVAAFRPACPSCMPIFVSGACSRTNATIRRHPATCASL